MRFLKLLVLPFLATLLVGAEKLPSGFDGNREMVINEGKQLYPVQLYGVAIQWHLDCIGGKSAMCLKLANAFIGGDGDLHPDNRVVVGYLLEACKKGSGKGCAEAASMIREGVPYPAIPALAYETAQTGCEKLGDQQSCAGMALHFYRGDAVAKDKAKALAMWDTACAAKAGDGCRLKAGALFYESSDANDHATAVDLYRAGCAAGQGWGCSGLADALSQGRGVARDDAAASEVGRKGCLEAKGEVINACAVYARLLANSSKKPADLGQAGKLLVRTCLAKIASACYEAGKLGAWNPSGNVIAQWEVPLAYREGCDLDYGPACLNLGMLYFEGFDKVQMDWKRAAPLIDKACRLGDQEACQVATVLAEELNAGRLVRPTIDPSLPARVQISQALELSKNGKGRDAFDTVARLMEEGVAEAQWVLGGWYYYGEPGVVDFPDRQKGVILFENAAKLGHVEAAKWIGMAYWYGDGIPENRKLGEGYMSLAAERGDRMAENILRGMLAEPLREDFARRQREADEAYERNKNDFWGALFSAMAAWKPSGGGYSAPSQSSSWQGTASIIDNHNFNNYVSYMQGSTSVCRTSNPYC